MSKWLHKDIRHAKRLHCNLTCLLTIDLDNLLMFRAAWSDMVVALQNVGGMSANTSALLLAEVHSLSGPDLASSRRR